MKVKSTACYENSGKEIPPTYNLLPPPATTCNRRIYIPHPSAKLHECDIDWETHFWEPAARPCGPSPRPPGSQPPPKAPRHNKLLLLSCLDQEFPLLCAGAQDFGSTLKYFFRTPRLWDIWGVLRKVSWHFPALRNSLGHFLCWRPGHLRAVASRHGIHGNVRLSGGVAGSVCLGTLRRANVRWQY